MPGPRPATPLTIAGAMGFQLLVAVYGGYFGAGLGILLFAGLAILLPDDIQHSNALKGLTEPKVPPSAGPRAK